MTWLFNLLWLNKHRAYFERRGKSLQGSPAIQSQLSGVSRAGSVCQQEPSLLRAAVFSLALCSLPEEECSLDFGNEYPLFISEPNPVWLVLCSHNSQFTSEDTGCSASQENRVEQALIKVKKGEEPPGLSFPSPS